MAMERAIVLSGIIKVDNLPEHFFTVKLTTLIESEYKRIWLLIIVVFVKDHVYFIHIR